MQQPLFDEIVHQFEGWEKFLHFQPTSFQNWHAGLLGF
jgi:hypothetical protein